MFTYEEWNAAPEVTAAGEALLLNFLKQAHAQGRAIQWMDRGDIFPHTFMRATPDHAYDAEFPNDGEWIVEAADSDFYTVQPGDALIQSLIPNLATLTLGGAA